MKYSFVVILFLAFSVHSSVLFSDNFSDPVQTHLDWNANMQDHMNLNFNDNRLLVTNSNTQFSGLVITELSQKPDTFTLSVQISGSSQEANGAGVLFCYQGTGLNGYLFNIQGNNLVAVQKYTSGGHSSLFQKQSAYLTSVSNELKIVKVGGGFHVFINGEYEGGFSDSEYSSGDIALLAPPSSQTYFESVALTTEYEPPSPRNKFITSFEGDGALVGWSHLSPDPGSQITEEDGVLKMVTDSQGVGVLYYVSIDLENFAARTVVSHRSGNTNQLYGLFLMGEPVGNVPMAFFGIAGFRQYAVYEADGVSPVVLQPSNKIRGTALKQDGNTHFFLDTLDVVKISDRDHYIFMVNGDTLGRLPEVDFAIKGIGIFGHKGMELFYEYFGVEEGSEIPDYIRVIRTPMVKHGNIQNRRGGTFDLLGRRINTEMDSRLRSDVLKPSGVYISDHEGRKLIVR